MKMFAWLKTVWKIRKPIKKLIKEVKVQMKNEPGKFTTEFWLTVVSNLIAIAGAIKGLISPEIAATVVAVLTAIYNVLRTWRKNSASKTG